MAEQRASDGAKQTVTGHSRPRHGVVRIGQPLALEEPKALPEGDIQVRTWCLVFAVFKAAIPIVETSLSVEPGLTNFLAAVHLCIGIRKFCKASNKVFLNVMRIELLKARKDSMRCATRPYVSAQISSTPSLVWPYLCVPPTPPARPCYR